MALSFFFVLLSVHAAADILLAVPTPAPEEGGEPDAEWVTLHATQVRRMLSMLPVDMPLEASEVAGGARRSTPGMIMAAAGLLNENPDATDEDIDAAITNICRCGTFTRVRKGIHLAKTKKA